MKALIGLAFGTALLATTNVAVADSTTSVNSAFTLCQIFDNTGLDSEPCSVDGWGSSVTVSLDMEPDEAKTMCNGVAAMMEEKGLSFDSGWTLQIKSPYSGSNTIAYCNL